MNPNVKENRQTDGNRPFYFCKTTYVSNMSKIGDNKVEFRVFCVHLLTAAVTIYQLSKN